LDAVPERVFQSLTRLTHFFHVYADGNFSTPIREHFREVKKSGLLRELDSVRVGMVGGEANRAKVLALFDELKVPVKVVAVASEGWEQVTLKKLHTFAKQDDGFIFYAHTKGAWSPDRMAHPWRVSMIHDTVTRWRECVRALDRVQTAGPFWLKSDDPMHKEHKKFFGGNFWWARSDYVAKLPRVKNENRFQAEGWIGLRSPSVRIMREGWSYWGNFWEPNENT
jgi:hypothetical protein